MPTFPQNEPDPRMPQPGLAVAQPLRGVPRELDLLHETATRLRDAITELRGQLEPALLESTPQPDKPNLNPDGPEPGSAIAIAIRETTSDLAGLIGWVADLTRRVDL